MIAKACNDFVLVIRDKTEKESSGLLLPSTGREKPHEGKIHAVGSLVKDHNLKAAKGKKCLFHKGVGWEIEYDGIVYLVLQDREIIGLP